MELYNRISLRSNRILLIRLIVIIVLVLLFYNYDFKNPFEITQKKIRDIYSQADKSNFLGLQFGIFKKRGDTSDLWKDLSSDFEGLDIQQNNEVQKISDSATVSSALGDIEAIIQKQLAKKDDKSTKINIGAINISASKEFVIMFFPAFYILSVFILKTHSLQQQIHLLWVAANEKKLSNLLNNDVGGPIINSEILEEKTFNNYLFSLNWENIFHRNPSGLNEVYYTLETFPLVLFLFYKWFEYLVISGEVASGVNDKQWATISFGVFIFFWVVVGWFSRRTCNTVIAGERQNARAWLNLPIIPPKTKRTKKKAEAEIEDKLKSSARFIPRLITVTVVLSILAAIAVPQFREYKTRAYNSDAKATLHNLFLACKANWADNGPNAPCTLEIAKQDIYGFSQPPRVDVVILDNREETFKVTATHELGDNFSIDSSGNIQ